MIAARLAWGNLGLHRRKSLLIGIIMGMGILILFIGNSFIDTALLGLQRMFVQGYTGDLMVTGPTEFPTTVLGETAGSEEVLPHIAQIKKYEDFLAGRNDVAATLPLLSGQAAFGIGETELGSGYCFGVNADDYRKFFPDNVTLVSGEWPKAGDGPWVLLSEPTLAILNKSATSPVQPGTHIIMTALANSAGTVIREVTVKGVIKFNQSNKQLEGLTLVDADTMRDLLGFASLRDGAPVLTGQEASFVSNFDPNALFENLFASNATVAAPAAAAPASTAQPGVKAEVIPAWQFLLVRVKPGASSSRLLSDLSAFSKQISDGDRVQDWIAGAGKVARTAVTIRLAFDLLVAVVAVVVVMIMMNVLIISVNERLYEIGTLRAIGAKRRVVRNMILYETVFLAAIAGAAGLVIGFVVLLLLGKFGIRAPNLFFEALFGGQVLKPMVSAGAAIRAFIWILAMGLGASWYPTIVALRIEPVIAMRGD
ncbi:MAG: ABC transporter permease [Rectinema subterraneum]|uniref:ABC transporter permease n=1 Tax=Rectinema subterraneum TaxID=2653714 RepID=UPI003C7C8ECB